MLIIHWFRGDLRLSDNTALAAACRRADELVPVFVFDRRLTAGTGGQGPRMRFLRDSLARLEGSLAERGSSLVVRIGEPVNCLTRLVEETKADALTFNRDYSPFARRRDDAVRRALSNLGVAVLEHKDRVIFEHDEIRSASAGAYRIYTPYQRAWWRRWEEVGCEMAPARRLPRSVDGIASESLEALDTDSAIVLPTGGERAGKRRLGSFLADRVRDYGTRRDMPAIDGTSRLSPYLRFGCLSIRQCVRDAMECAELEPRAADGVRRWIGQLIWREFYQALLAEEPRVLRESFRPELRDIDWEDDDAGFEAWCRGETGFPLVDAGMRQLAETGWMHNRLRMITASFLVKDLLVDWRRGERWFFDRLVDGDPASNNGGWQWAASTGTDAQPYFRIFNPVRQGERFDPEGKFVRRFVPELGDVPDRFVHRPHEAPSPPRNYPEPIVDHATRRVLAIERFRAARVSVRSR